MASWNPDRKTAALAALRRVNEEIEAAAGLLDTPEERARLIRSLDLASYFKLLAARQFPGIDPEDPAAPAIDFEQLYLCYFDLYAIAEAISNTLTKTAAGQPLGPGDQTLDQGIEWVERLLERIADWFDVLLSDECEAQLAKVDNALQELLDLLQRVKRRRPGLATTDRGQSRRAAGVLLLPGLSDGRGALRFLGRVRLSQRDRQAALRRQAARRGCSLRPGRRARAARLCPRGQGGVGGTDPGRRPRAAAARDSRRTRRGQRVALQAGPRGSAAVSATWIRLSAGHRGGWFGQRLALLAF